MPVMCLIDFATDKKRLLRGLGVLFLDKYPKMDYSITKISNIEPFHTSVDTLRLEKLTVSQANC